MDLLPSDLDREVVIDDLEALGAAEQPVMDRGLSMRDLESEWAFTDYPRCTYTLKKRRKKYLKCL